MHAAFTKNGMNVSFTPCSFSTRSLYPLAQRVDGRHVDLVERREVRGVVLRLEEVLGDALAARRHLLARLALAGCAGAVAARGGDGTAQPLRDQRRCGVPRARGCSAGMLDHIGLATHAAAAGAGDSGDVDAPLVGDRRAAGDDFVLRLEAAVPVAAEPACRSLPEPRLSAGAG